MKNILPTFLVLLLMSLSASAADKPLVFVSSFAGGEHGAIQAFHLDPESGALESAARTGDIGNPFFMALSSDHKFLYAVHAEKFGGDENEEVAAYSIENGEGKLRLLNRQPSHGTATCYLDIDDSGKALVLANYSSGNVASLPVAEDGSLKEAASIVQHEGSSANPKRQKGPNAHSIVVSPDNRFVYAADLGIDKILCYRLDAEAGKISSNAEHPFAALAPGSGPRHLSFHPDGKHLYAINELLNTITVYSYASDSGVLTEVQTISTLPGDFDGVTHTADLKITPDGKYLYGTNRGHDSIAAYRIGEDRKLTLIGIVPSLGKGPQNLAITADGKWLLCANLPDSNVVVFAIDSESGKIKAAGEPVEITKPACIMIVE